MVKKILFLSSIPALLVLLLMAFTSNNQVVWSDETNVTDALIQLGEAPPKHYLEHIQADLIKKGEEIVKQGYTFDNEGKRTKIQSKYFVCTDCHNQKREDPDLRFSNPDTRLDYVVKNNLPFLQGSSFYGIVNRTSWYNDDYYKKYGELVRPANSSLREAIHLCAVECAQGRALADWEMEAVLAYLWSLQLTLGDLELTEVEWSKFKNIKDKQSGSKEIIDLIRSKYLSASPATFSDVPQRLDLGYELTGDPENGQRIYEYSCRHCHARKQAAKYLTLDYDPLTFGLLNRHMDNFNKYNIYRMIRKGTYALPGHRPYMPRYPLEKMSNQQIEDLRAYIQQQAK